MYGVTHVCAVDGYTGMIVGLISMPVKNCATIYADLYRLNSYTVIGVLFQLLFHGLTLRPMLLEYGIWDQIRVDYGTESALMLYVQDALRLRRYNSGRSPYIQSSSREVKRHIRVLSHI